MRRHANTRVAIGAALFIGGSAFAQQAQPQKPPVTQEQKPPVTQEKSPMAMGDMMKGCRDHCEQTSASIDRVMQTIDEAKQSNDPVKMRQALDQAQKPIADMKQHMSMCRNMMNMMEKMHGMGSPK